jgi:hypothetical protein
VRGENVEDILVIPLELNSDVSCFPTFKFSQKEVYTCGRYELTFESPEYYPSAKTFHDQDAGITDSRGRLKVSGDLYPKRRQVCTLRQKEMEIKKLTEKYSDTSVNLQDLSIALDDITLIAELKLNANIYDLNDSSVTAKMRDRGGVDPATLAKNWVIGIEASKRTCLVTTQMGDKEYNSPKFDKAVQYQ